MYAAKAIAIALLAITVNVAADEVVESDDIVKALEDKPTTRSITRGVGVRVKSKVDLKIPFEYNSSTLAPEAERQLSQLADALARDSLADFRFEVAGHTDASGSAEYNRKLSEQRARSVMRFLVDAGIDGQRLEATGYGEDRLLRRDDPRHADNRRVEIRNLGQADKN